MKLEQCAAWAHEHRAQLYRTAYGCLGDQASALEAVDETVYRALKSLRQLRDPGRLAPWMMQILLNVCRRELRRRKRELPMETLPEAASEAFDALPLREAVSRLPEELRSVVALRYFAGFTVAETAEALGIPQGTAATRQRRALSLLKLDLEEEL